METICRTVQRTLTESGREALRHDAGAERHLAECPDCFALLERVAELDTSLAQLTPHDASDAVVDTLLERIEGENHHASAPRHSLLDRLAALPRPGLLAWGTVMASVVLLVTAGWLFTGHRGTTPSVVRSEEVPETVEVAEVHDNRGDDDPELQREAEDRKQANSDKNRPLSADVNDLQRGSGVNKKPRAADEIRQAYPDLPEFTASPLPPPPVAKPVPPRPVARTVPPPPQNERVAGPLLRPGTSSDRLDGDHDRDGRESSTKPAKEDELPRALEQTSREKIVELVREESNRRSGSNAEQLALDSEPGRLKGATKFSDGFVQDIPVPGRFYQNVLTLAPGASDPGDDNSIGDSEGDGESVVHGSRSRDFKAVVGGVSNVDPLTGQLMETVDAVMTEEIVVVPGGAGLEFARAQAGFDEIVQKQGGDKTVAGAASEFEVTEHDLQLARAFLATRASHEGQTFKQASGYWSNSYVPGDSTLRTLQARLGSADRSSLWQTVPVLHDASRRTAQPFDPPERAALTAYLHADRAAISEPGRMLVQVGLQATSRQGGGRSEINLAIVLDLHDALSVGKAAGVRALLDALEQARQPGDNFALYVAGRPGGLAIAPDQFRHGVLSVTLGRLLGDDEPLEGPTLSLTDALGLAIDRLTGADDPTAPLGSSAVFVVSPSSFGDPVESLAKLAHLSAIAGVPVGVIGVGRDVDLDQIERLTLAGQGNRRLLLAPSEAAGLIDRELAAASRAVARAVRLRIRLAPGVKLIDVLGSRSLDDAHAEQVRQAEQGIDRRVATSLGIGADRGEDEEGIQVVIPAFYAGDSHVVLLDVVASSPGKIADVQLRYKDLVHLRNGVARASLALPRGDDAPGPLERNVLKNLLALRVSTTLDLAGRALSGGDSDRAIALLETLRGMLTGLTALVPGLERDADLLADINMVDEYVALLEAGDTSDRMWAYLSDSLRYAARLKILPAPVTD